MTRMCVSLVLDIPCWLVDPNAGGRDNPPVRKLIPGLFIEFEGDVFVLPEAFLWAANLIFQETPDQVHAEVSTIARLIQHWADGGCADLLEAADVDSLIYSYFYRRIKGSNDFQNGGLLPSRTVTFETAANEFKSIRQYANFCAKHPMPKGAISSALKLHSGIWDAAPKVSNSRRFLSHLNAARERYLTLVGIEEVRLPRSLKRAARSARSGKPHSFKTISGDQVEQVINCEQNLIFKALWIILAYGGLRICEALQMYICDVLPGSYSREFTGVDLGPAPFVIVAHPEHSTYFGSMKTTLLTRSDFLKDRFNLVPRTILERGERVGWKGISEFDPQRSLSWVYWSDIAKAHQFEQLTKTLQAIRQDVMADDMHPFLFFNSKNFEYLGLPLRIKNAERAFRAACVRAGVTVGGKTPGPHVLRHHYKWRLENVLGLSPPQIQTAMRHRSIDSQLDYGLMTTSLHQSLGNAMRRAA